MAPHTFQTPNVAEINPLNRAAHHVAAMLRIGALREAEPAAAEPAENPAAEYTVYRHYMNGSVYGPERWAVRRTGQRDADPPLLGPGDALDIFKTRSGARHAANMLNRGAATVDRHALLGCRIIPRDLAKAAARSL